MNNLNCRHGIPMAQTGNGFINSCGFCTSTKKVFSMPSPGERYTNGQQIYLTEEEEQETRDETHERDLFRHWEFGEAQIGQIDHIDSMRPLDRLIVESAVASSEKVNRINYAGVEDRRPYFDRLDTLARFMHVVDETGRPEPIAEVTLTAFRALDLNERDRRRLALQIASNHSKIHDLTATVEDVGQEIIPPYPIDIVGCDTVEDILSLDQWTQDIDGSEESDDLEPIEKAFTSEIAPMDQKDLYATPIGHLDAMDYCTAGYETPDGWKPIRSERFRHLMQGITLAVQTDDGRALAQIGKEIHAIKGVLRGQEAGVLFFHHKVATNKTAARLEHRLDVLLETIHNHPKPWKLGKILSGLQKDQTPSTHRTETPVDRWMLRSKRAGAWKMETTYETNGGRPKFTSAQWGVIWEAYRVRVPKRQAPEQIPLFEPPAF